MVLSFVCGEVLPATAVVMYNSLCCVLGRIKLADVFVLQSGRFEVFGGRSVEAAHAALLQVDGLWLLQPAAALGFFGITHMA